MWGKDIWLQVLREKQPEAGGSGESWQAEQLVDIGRGDWQREEWAEASGGQQTGRGSLSQWSGSRGPDGACRRSGHQQLQNPQFHFRPECCAEHQAARVALPAGDGSDLAWARQEAGVPAVLRPAAAALPRHQPPPPPAAAGRGRALGPGATSPVCPAAERLPSDLQQRQRVRGVSPRATISVLRR